MGELLPDLTSSTDRQPVLDHNGHPRAAQDRSVPEPGSRGRHRRAGGGASRARGSSVDPGEHLRIGVRVVPRGVGAGRASG
jgi:hypothetical protein